MADPTDGFYIQDKLDDVPNGIVRVQEDHPQQDGCRSSMMT
jgi:hypothetical protein